MAEYTKQELQELVQWQHDQLEQQARVVDHLREVINLYIADSIELDDLMEHHKLTTDGEDNLVYRLRKRAEIRRQIDTRKSVQEGKPDRIADLLEEAATAFESIIRLTSEE